MHTGTTDLPLTTQGEENARQLRGRLRGVTFDAVYSSPMKRARRTAELAGFPHPSITELLKEADYGRYEGLTTEQIHAIDPDWELYADGCPGGEAPAQLYERARTFIELATQQGDARVIAFSHGHILRTIAVAWMSVDVTVAARLQLDVATISVLRDADRGRVVALWNAA